MQLNYLELFVIKKNISLFLQNTRKNGEIITLT